MDIVYPHTLIPMGTEDRIHFLKEVFPIKDLHFSTHWLISVEAPKNMNGFCVYISPATQVGVIEKFKKPLFISKEVESVNDCILLQNSFIEISEQDVLFKKCLHLKRKTHIIIGRKRRLLYFSLKKKKENTV